jgi:PUA-domain protein
VSELTRRRFLREKEAIQLLNDFSQKMKLDPKQLFEANNPKVEVADTSIGKVYFINGKPIIATLKGTSFPTLVFDRALKLMPKITVNMGAVPHICNGADLMAPGIVEIQGDFNANDFVLIVDEKYRKPLAIVVALTDSRSLSDLKHGKVAENKHYVGDVLWSILKKA